MQHDKKSWRDGDKDDQVDVCCFLEWKSDQYFSLNQICIQCQGMTMYWLIHVPIAQF